MVLYFFSPGKSAVVVFHYYGLCFTKSSLQNYHLCIVILKVHGAVQCTVLQKYLYFLSGKASPWGKKNLFSSTGHKMCSLPYFGFADTGTLSVQDLWPKSLNFLVISLAPKGCQFRQTLCDTGLWLGYNRLIYGPDQVIAKFSRIP